MTHEQVAAEMQRIVGKCGGTLHEDTAAVLSAWHLDATAKARRETVERCAKITDERAAYCFNPHLSYRARDITDNLVRLASAIRALDANTAPRPPIDEDGCCASCGRGLEPCPACEPRAKEGGEA